jgi:hypothetical protein
MTGGAGPLTIDPGLVKRFRAAGAEVRWRDAGENAPTAPRVRIARLHEEEARIEEHPTSGGPRLRVESCPVGALLLLLEVDRRGSMPALRSVESGADAGFPNGAIEARWDADAGTSTVGLRDVVEVARYALV